MLHSDGAVDNEAYGNWVETQTTRSSEEYGWNYAVAFSNRWGPRNGENYVHDNVFITHAGDDFDGQGTISRSRTLFLGALEEAVSERIEDNVIVSFAHDDATETHAIGIGGGGANPGLVLRGNFLATHDCTWTGEYYGECWGYPRFIDNTFERIGNDPSFATHRSTYGDTEVDFISNDYAGGAAIDDLDFDFQGGSPKDARFGWNVTVTATKAGSPVNAATVTVKSAAGATLATGTTASNGVAVIPVVCYRRTNIGSGNQGANGGTVDLRPLTVTVTSAGQSASDTTSPTDDVSVPITLP
jgi:hypothetical protein